MGSYLVLLEELRARLMLISLSEKTSGLWEWEDLSVKFSCSERVSNLAASWSMLSIFRSLEQSPSNWKLLWPSMSPIREGETSEDEVKLGANFSFHLGLVKGFCFRFASLLGIGQADIDREDTAGHGEKFVFSGEIMMPNGSTGPFNLINFAFTWLLGCLSAWLLRFLSRRNELGLSRVVEVSTT